MQFSCSLAKLNRIQNDDQNYRILVRLNGKGHVWKVQETIACLKVTLSNCLVFKTSSRANPLDLLETISTYRSNLFSKGNLTWKSAIALMFSLIVKTVTCLRATNQSSNFHTMANLLITWRYLNQDRLDHSELFTLEWQYVYAFDFKYLYLLTVIFI